jgi:hypothetical protein
MLSKIFYRIEAGVPMPGAHQRRRASPERLELADALTRMAPGESVLWEGKRHVIYYAARSAAVEVASKPEGRAWRVWRTR